MADALSLWQRYCDYIYTNRSLGISLDISRMNFDEEYLNSMKPAIHQAMDAMEALESGAIANKDENRMVGHYWLRTPSLAPSDDITNEITRTNAKILSFAKSIHDGTVHAQSGPYKHLIHVGIGGSALGPQFVARALAGNNDPVTPHFVDNTDPDGIDQVIDKLHDQLEQTLVTVVSKSGGTPEPRNGMLEVTAAYEKAGLRFADRAIAITMEGSKLDKQAESEGWLARFPLWDWVGGRTSVMSAVGLVPAALQGIDIESILKGAAAMDEVTRDHDIRNNPAALLALMWYKVGNGKGAKDMVILPYKDRLELFSRYLQQLVMESLGKRLDRDGNVVNQGIAVYGNKGSTDQHAYVQQLRDGVNNFFATFIQVLKDRDGDSINVEPGTTAGDFLCGFLQGTRRALFEGGRDSMTITIPEVTPFYVGALIALYDRAVGYYGELVNINAYHQPGVEAGKKAAAAVLDLQAKAMSHLASATGSSTAEEIASAIGNPEEAEVVYKILEHLAANDNRGVVATFGDSPATTTFHAG
ncbi:Glucose-6-phosphate isomerase [Planctomycetes bacterium Pan216]|uniref:Glucose-6-phosphate isomerase n=1 Tax=Kolteria novifilia TaxID=2527975 RepID=A0A518AY93_9BACT|nr:Glucose-6-phosphate isomerase [Planctomycetes bacterium Pan216]